MIRASCGAENQPGKKFCGDCGAPLAAACPACGSANEPGKRFCGDCGSALPPTAAAPAPSTSPVSREGPSAERRLVSILFADLVGFTTLSESRDAEEVRDLLTRYFDTCRTLITRYGGTIEKFIGDAVMAVWGTPVATEDDAERAVRAALDLTRAVAELGAEVGAPELRARAGVLTGEAAVNLHHVSLGGPARNAGDPLRTEPGGCDHLAGHRPATPPGLRQRERANAAVGRGRVHHSTRHGGGAPDVGSDLAGLPKLPPVTGTRRIPPLGTQGPLRT